MNAVKKTDLVGEKKPWKSYFLAKIVYLINIQCFEEFKLVSQRVLLVADRCSCHKLEMCLSVQHTDSLRLDVQIMV